MSGTSKKGQQHAARVSVQQFLGAKARQQDLSSEAHGRFVDHLHYSCRS